MDTVKINKHQAKMIAHRGLSGLERENTNVAFVAAGQRTHFGIETDVYRTVDGPYVLHHDYSTARGAIADLKIPESTFETLRAIKLLDKDGVTKRNDLRIPTLEEYIRTCKRYDKVGVLEFKTVYKPEHIAEMVDIIRREDYLDGIIFISFALDNLIHLREILPGHPCQFLTGEWNDALIPTLVEHKMDLDIYWEQLTEERIALCHQNGIVVNAWTVDDPGAGEKLAAWGIDYITSNILE